MEPRQIQQGIQQPLRGRHGGRRSILLAGVAALIGLAGVGGYVIGTRTSAREPLNDQIVKSDPSPRQMLPASQDAITSAASAPTGSWKAYASEGGRYIVTYPADFTMHTHEVHASEQDRYQPTPNVVEL